MKKLTLVAPITPKQICETKGNISPIRRKESPRRNCERKERIMKLFPALLQLGSTTAFLVSRGATISSSSHSSMSQTTTALKVSELHIPGYRESKMPFILTEEDMSSSDGSTIVAIQEKTYTCQDYESQIPYESGHLLHKTKNQVFSTQECQYIVQEAEYIADQMGWTTNRHGNYPTTDIPLVELPNTLRFLKRTLVERIYPLLRTQFQEFLPPGDAPFKLRVADGFIVKYDAEGGQSELKPHRDGSVLSFNIALNPAHEFEGGGTWFNSLNDAVKIDEGQMVSHASGVLHGGHAITSGKRYILVAFVILEGYDAWSMRFYNSIRDK